VLLTWLWLSSLVLLVGAELDVVLDRHVGAVVDGATAVPPGGVEATAATRPASASIQHGTGAGFAVGAVVGAALAAAVLRGRRAG
jgi:hypothetical protein